MRPSAVTAAGNSISVGRHNTTIAFKQSTYDSQPSATLDNGQYNSLYFGQSRTLSTSLWVIHVPLRERCLRC